MENNIENVFVDCFDTIIQRDCHPEHIKRIWANKLAVLLNYKLDGCQLYDMRRQTECELGLTSLNNGFDGEYGVRRVYDKINKKLIVSGLVAQTDLVSADKMLELELSVEFEHQSGLEKTIAFLKTQKNLGKKIYLVSDFYMGQEQMCLFLENLGIRTLFDSLFVSCDYNANKRSGKLYDVVLNELKVEPRSCIMIGDNKISDIENSKKKGIRAKRITDAKKYKFQDLQQLDVYNAYFKKLFNKNKKYELENYAFCLFGFIQNLAIKCKQDGIKKLFFLSREGQFLKRLFDVYCEIFKIDIDTKYLMVSRNSTYIASLGDIDVEKFDGLFRQDNNISIYDVLKSLSFEDGEVDEVKNSLNLDIYKNLRNTAESNELKLLKQSSVFREIYDKKRQAQRVLFKQYLEQEGFKFSEALNIVDVGWRGTMQDSMARIFDYKVKINGLYLGLNEIGAGCNNSTKAGLLFDYVRYGTSLRNKILSSFQQFYECILRANHSRTDRYELVDGVVEPILEEGNDALFYDKYLQDYHKNVLEKFCQIADIINNNAITAEMFNKILPKVKLKMLFKLSWADYQFLNANLDSFKDAFGKNLERIEHSESLLTYLLVKASAVKRLIIYRNEL